MKTSVSSFFGRCLTLLLATLASTAASLAAPAVPDTLDLKTAIGFALENNFAIRQARERIRQQEGIVIEVTAREIPNVAATGGYQHNDTAITVQSPPSDRYWTISLTATQVLFAGGGVRSAIKSADLTREAALLDLRNHPDVVNALGRYYVDVTTLDPSLKNEDAYYDGLRDVAQRLGH